MQRHDILNKLIETYSYKNYLEVGTQHGNCFRNINLPRADKLCIDIEKAYDDLDLEISSDEFFAKNTKTYDLIFIDGDHSYKQSYIDILNALKCLSEGGAIVCHDCYPESIDETLPSCKGEVYKSILVLRMTRPDLTVKVVNSDCGVGIIKVGTSETLEKRDNLEFNYFLQNAKEMLNLVSVEEFVSNP